MEPDYHDHETVLGQTVGGEGYLGRKPSREQTVMDAIFLREIKLQSQLEGLKSLRRNLSLAVLEGPISSLDAIFHLKD